MLAKFHHIFHLLRNPDTAVITKRLRHKGQFALLVTMNRNTGRVNLCKAGICEESSLLIALPCRRSVRIHCVGRKEISISITSRCKYNSMSTESLYFTGNKVARNYTLCLTIDNYKIKHLMSRVTLDSSGSYFFVK